MFCSRCGKEYTGNFCPFCGAREKLGSFSHLRPLLIDPTEKICAVLGNNFAQTFLSTGVLGRGFFILSDRRVYFKGACLSRQEKGIYTKTQEQTVGLEDITGTGYVHNNAIWAKILHFLCAALCPIFFLAFCFSGNIGVGFLFGLLFAAVSLLFYFLHKFLTYSLFEISYAGGKIQSKLFWFDLGTSREFQKELHLQKQALLFPQKSVTTPIKDTADQNESAKQVTPTQPRTSGCVTSSGWRCVCGREHAAYVSSCPCGKSKRDVLK